VRPNSVSFYFILESDEEESEDDEGKPRAPGAVKVESDEVHPPDAPEIVLF
jgi:hypothetical protein